MMDQTGMPNFMWFECIMYASSILKMISMDCLGGRNAIEVALGHSVDILAIIALKILSPMEFKTC